MWSCHRRNQPRVLKLLKDCFGIRSWRSSRFSPLCGSKPCSRKATHSKAELHGHVALTFLCLPLSHHLWLIDPKVNITFSALPKNLMTNVGLCYLVPSCVLRNLRNSNLRHQNANLWSTAAMSKLQPETIEDSIETTLKKNLSSMLLPLPERIKNKFQSTSQRAAQMLSWWLASMTGRRQWSGSVRTWILKLMHRDSDSNASWQCLCMAAAFFRSHIVRSNDSLCRFTCHENHRPHPQWSPSSSKPSLRLTHGKCQILIGCQQETDRRIM